MTGVLYIPIAEASHVFWGSGFGGNMFWFGYFINPAYSAWLLQIAYPSFKLVSISKQEAMPTGCYGNVLNWAWTGTAGKA